LKAYSKRNRLPTKHNLHRCGIITSDAQFCVAECGSLESVEHLSLDCRCFGSLWQLIHMMLGLAVTAPQGIMDHFVQFDNLTGTSKQRRFIIQLISLSCTWII